MRNRFTGAMVAMAVAAAVSLTVMPLAGQAGRGAAPAGGAAPAPAGQGRGAAPHPRSPRAVARRRRVRRALPASRTSMASGRRSAPPTGTSRITRRRPQRSSGSSAPSRAIPAGQSVVEGGTIPYLPGGAEEARRRTWPAGRRRIPRRSATCPASRARPTCPIRSRSSRGRRTSCSSTSTPARTASST